MNPKIQSYYGLCRKGQFEVHSKENIPFHIQIMVDRENACGNKCDFLDENSGVCTLFGKKLEYDKKEKVFYRRKVCQWLADKG